MPDAAMQKSGLDRAEDLRDLALTDADAAADAITEGHLGQSAEADAVIADAVATIAKREHLRSPLRERRIPQALVGVVRRSAADGVVRDVAALTHALRALGNLCFDHDGNRAAVLEAGGVDAIRDAMSSLLTDPACATRNESDLSHAAAAGVVLNLANDNKTTHKACVDAGVPRLVAALIATAMTELETAMALRAAALFSADSGLLTGMCDDNGGSAVTALVSRLESTVEEAAHEGCDDDGEVDGATACEIECTLLREMVKEDGRLSVFRSAELLARVRALVDVRGRKVPSGIAATAAVVFAVVLGDDGCLETVIGDIGMDELLATAVRWMSARRDYPDEWDVPSAGAIAVGNIARTADHAARVATTDGALEELVGMTESDKSGLQFAALGALKNLAVLDANKAELARRGVMAAVTAGLKSPQAALQYGAASLARSLCVSPAAVPVVLATGGGAALVERLVHLAGQEEEAVRSEATRALGNLCRHAPRSNDETDSIESALCSAAPWLVAMVSSQHTVLVSDALLALVALSSRSSIGRAAVAAAGARAAAVDCLSVRREPAIACNALTLIGALGSCGEGGSGAESDDGDDNRRHIAEAVRASAELGPEVAEQSRKVLAILGEMS